MRIDSISGMPSEVEGPATPGAATAAATEINVLSNDSEAPVSAVAEAQKIAPPAPDRRGETVWLQNEKRQVYRLVDRKSGDVVSQVPSDEVLRVARNLEELCDTEEKQSVDVTS